MGSSLRGVPLLPQLKLHDVWAVESYHQGSSLGLAVGLWLQGALGSGWCEAVKNPAVEITQLLR